MTFTTGDFRHPPNPKTSHARVRSNFARVLEWSCGVVVLWGSGESEIRDRRLAVEHLLCVVGEHRLSNNLLYRKTHRGRSYVRYTGDGNRNGGWHLNI